ncbi:hypothetical protein [Tropicimonas sediminicola]|uniref:hypothetical protein n=1 Tax=Tropicimonas sediminicola TaxID=1031541 RepID=UPI00113112C2|nr:hypothetical protein [Tropicimonas sediminicola]
MRLKIAKNGLFNANRYADFKRRLPVHGTMLHLRSTHPTSTARLRSQPPNTSVWALIVTNPAALPTLWTSSDNTQMAASGSNLRLMLFAAFIKREGSLNSPQTQNARWSA